MISGHTQPSLKLSTTQEPPIHPKPTGVTNNSIRGVTRRLGVWIRAFVPLLAQCLVYVALRSGAGLCPRTAPERVSEPGCECSPCARSPAPRSPAPRGLTQLLPFHCSPFWEVFWATCSKEVSRTRCRNAISAHCKNCQKQEAERCHSDTRNVFMTPTEKGARKQSAHLSTHRQTSAQQEERLLITCCVKQPVKEAKLGKDNSI